MSALGDRFRAARSVADAVLYEGYVLYPYRASARKNQLRWPFGVLAPPGFAAADPSERASLRLECLVDPDASSEPRLTVLVRCLHVQERSVEAGDFGSGDFGSGDFGSGHFVPCERLVVGDAVWSPWDEAVTHEQELRDLPLVAGATPHRSTIDLPAGEEIEELCSTDGADATVLGRLIRRRCAVQGRLEVSAEPADGGGPWLKVTVQVENLTEWPPPKQKAGAGPGSREELLRHSLVAVHVLASVDGGRFVSLLDPPAGATAPVAGCANDGVWPVLVGAGDEDDVVLASPIILYDHPVVAPESPGDLYDATEIDEILALRVLTLTDEEKAEARGTDRRAAAIVERCETMSPERWSDLHATMRPLTGRDEPAVGREDVPWWEPAVDEAVDPWTETVWSGGMEIGPGTKVVVHPNGRADAQDMFYEGLRGTVAGVFRDADNDVHVALSLDDDPATELLEVQRTYRFFRPDELEALR